MREDFQKRIRNILTAKGYDGGTANGLLMLLEDDFDKHYPNSEKQSLEWIMMMEAKLCLPCPLPEHSEEEIENLISEQVINEEIRRNHYEYTIMYYASNHNNEETT